MRADFNGLPEIATPEPLLRDILDCSGAIAKCASPQSSQRQRVALALYFVSCRLVRHLLKQQADFYLV